MKKPITPNVPNTTAKKKLTKALPKGLSFDQASSLLSSLSEIQKHRADIKKSEFDIKKLEVQERLIIGEMEQKYELYNKVFTTIFKERSESINKTFDIIDRGIKENDKDLISMGLNGLSTIVSSSPFSNLNELSNLLESGGKIEL